ncbi:unnamed protein product, partial [marine sediment metagenome]
SVDELYKLGWHEGMELRVNRKTLGGVFTWLNGGIYRTCAIAKKLNLTTNGNLKKLEEDINSMQTEIGREKRWEAIGQKQKEPIYDKLRDCWYPLLIGKEKVIYEFYNERLSHLDYIGNKLSLSRKVKYDETICIEKIKEFGIQIGELCIRFKTAGGRVNSTPKMNCEYSKFIQ